MKAGVKKIEDSEGKNLVTKEEAEQFKGRIVILNPEESEIAKNLEITETGVFAIRLR